MATSIIMPDLGVPEAIIGVWFARPGDHVYEGDRLLEVVLGAATFDIDAPTTGFLVERWAHPNDRVRVGQILGMVAEEA